MMSISQVVGPIVTLIWPTAAKYLMETYEYRGAALILSALSLNTMVGVATFQPVERHMVKVRKPTIRNGNGT